MKSVGVGYRLVISFVIGIENDWGKVRTEIMGNRAFSCWALAFFGLGLDLREWIVVPFPESRPQVGGRVLEAREGHFHGLALKR